MHLAVLLTYDSVSQALVYTTVNIASYLIVIYGNASLLLPLLYEKRKKTLYVLAAIGLVLFTIGFKYGLNLLAYNCLFAVQPEPFHWAPVFSSLTTVVLVYISSIMFYMALRYFRLREEQAVLLRQQAETELDLLKSQVQPHFLFNTLNNIYFVAQRESPLTAALLEKLSSIMRYFVDEAPKERILLSAELNFIDNYIELEKMRMRYPLRVTMQTNDLPEQLRVPPMLCIPLVENVFKHGIDKLREDNFIEITLAYADSKLHVKVKNLLLNETVKQTSGMGLRNLRERLQLLFHGEAMFGITKQHDIFIAELVIPVNT